MSNAIHAAHAAPIIHIGVTYMTTFISCLVSSAVGFGLGWYVKGRGMTGIQIDLNNVKTDIADLKGRFGGPTPTPVSV